MWAEILDFIEPVIQTEKSDGEKFKEHVKFALYSGHDSTIAPLMASLSPNLWNDTDFPWYASMMLIEVRGHDLGRGISLDTRYTTHQLYPLSNY
mmetsp:Transcript_19167/g.35778  ORF Transcript_19167/g.35778 Transcript_19167/m.35778 type:complete len:94 (+) Transcript_19167:891-1172(+)